MPLTGITSRPILRNQKSKFEKKTTKKTRSGMRRISNDVIGKNDEDKPYFEVNFMSKVSFSFFFFSK